jgi:uncharacterized Zn finger protein
MAKVVFSQIQNLHQQTGLKLKEETSEMLHLECSCVWRCNLDPSEIRFEIP